MADDQDESRAGKDVGGPADRSAQPHHPEPGDQVPVRTSPLLGGLERRGGLSEKYDADQVDEFLVRAHHALLRQDGSLTVQDVRGQRFTPVRLGQGYVMDEVDGLLDRAVIPMLQGRIVYAPEPDVPGQEDPVPDDRDLRGEDHRRGAHPAEQSPGLFRRLFGRDR